MLLSRPARQHRYGCSAVCTPAEMGAASKPMSYGWVGRQEHDKSVIYERMSPSSRRPWQLSRSHRDNVDTYQQGLDSLRAVRLSTSPWQCLMPAVVKTAAGSRQDAIESSSPYLRPGQAVKARSSTQGRARRLRKPCSTTSNNASARPGRSRSAPPPSPR